METPEGRDLCHGCGLCCTGWVDNAVKLTHQEAALFRDIADVTMRADDAEMPQPCACHDGACVRYDARPFVCRRFECLSLAAWRQGDIDFGEARARIDAAVAAVAAIEEDLAASGWTRPGEAGAPAWHRFMRALRSAPDPVAFRRKYGAVLLKVVAYERLARTALVRNLVVE